MDYKALLHELGSKKTSRSSCQAVQIASKCELTDYIFDKVLAHGHNSFPIADRTVKTPGMVVRNGTEGHSLSYMNDKIMI